MRLHYYTQGDEEKNLGDWLTVPLMRALGHEPEPAAPGESVLFGIGTIVTQLHFDDTAAGRIVVWGSGTHGNSGYPCNKPVSYLAVRGPITRKLLGLPDATPLGDPALLVPFVLDPPPPTPDPGEFIFVSHCGQKSVTPDGFDACVSMRTKPENAMCVVGRIAGAGFVASESLHGCILAQAFGVPWALCSPRPWELGPANKYDDWFLSVGLDYPAAFLPPDRRVCLDWWESTGRKAKTPDVRPLLDAFPHGGL